MSKNTAIENPEITIDELPVCADAMQKALVKASAQPAALAGTAPGVTPDSAGGPGPGDTDK